MIDMSRMPTSDMLSVRGIGVALIVSTSTFFFSCLIFSLCATPKRCSSSTTSSPRSRNSTSFDSSRCVPTMMSTLPAARSASVSFCSALRAEAAHHVDAHRKAGEALPQRLLVLKRQNRRRREERDLLAVHHRLERGAHRHFGLAVADVAAEQPVHRRRRFHVALDVGDRRLLIERQLVLERVLELLLPVRIGAERVAGHRLARGVELEQLLRHVAHRLLDLGLRALPRRAAEPIDRRPRRAGVLLHEVEPLDRDEQLVLAGVAQLEELLHAVADADLLQADEHADAVVDVDDEVADLEVAQVGEKRLRRRPAPLGRAALFLEDVGFGVDLQAGVRQTEPARQRADRDEHRGVPRVLGALDRDREDVVFLEQLDRPLGAARRRGDKQRRLAGVAQPPDLGRPSPARAPSVPRPAGSGRGAPAAVADPAVGCGASSSSPSCASCVA